MGAGQAVPAALVTNLPKIPDSSRTVPVLPQSVTLLQDKLAGEAVGAVSGGQLPGPCCPLVALSSPSSCLCCFSIALSGSSPWVVPGPED